MITGAFVILGFTPQTAVLLLFAVIIGGAINIPVKKWPPNPEIIDNFKGIPAFRRFFRPRPRILAVNVGGAIIPGVISLWQVYRIYTEFVYVHPGVVAVFPMIFLLNTFVSYKIAKPVEGKGIVMPALIPPLVVSITSLMFYPEIAPVLAFPAGVLGVLTGADILHLKDIKKLNAPVGSIGGAGTFDGVFLCGILSVFLTG